MAIASKPPTAWSWPGQPSGTIQSTSPRTVASSSATSSPSTASATPVRSHPPSAAARLVTVQGSHRPKVVRQARNPKGKVDPLPDALARVANASPAQSSSNHDVAPSSPALSIQTTPELSTSGSLTPGSSPFTPQRYVKATGRPVVQSSPTASTPGIEQSPAMASRESTTITQHERNMSGSSSIPSSPSAHSLNDGSAAKVLAPSRRQLMPSIPQRRTSNVNESHSASSSKQSSPMLGNQTNIQSLAQAIAARAQHVAAAKATQAQPVQPSSNGSVSASEAVRPPEASVEEERVPGPRLSATSAEPTKLRYARLSVASTIASDYGDEPSTDGHSSDHAQSSTDAPAPPDNSTPRPAASSSNLRADRNEVAQSFRWSQGDWADYANALSHEIDTGSSTADSSVTNSASNNTDSVVTPPSTRDIAEVRRSTHFAPAHTLTSSSNSGGDVPALLSGLGIGGISPTSPTALGAAVELTETRRASKERSSLVKSATVPSSNGYGAPLLVQIGRDAADGAGKGADIGTSTAEGSALSTPDGTVSPRKMRPNPLQLVSSPSAPSLRSPSASRSLASPSMGGRTPPPTMPPTEPLPPLPADSTILRRMWGSPESNRQSGGSSHAPSQSDVRTPVLHGHTESVATFDEDRDRSKRSSDPSDNRSYFMRSHEPQADGTPVNLPRKNSLPYAAFSPPASAVTPASLSAQSIALAKANRLSTIAGAEHAQAVLDQMQHELTYDEAHGAGKRPRRTSQQSTSATSSSARHSATSNSPSQHQRQVLGKTADVGRIGDVEEEEQLRDTDAEAEDEGGEQEGDEEEEEEAVVTRAVTKTVTGARASLSRAPSIVRRGSNTSLAGSQAQSDSPVGSVRGDVSGSRRGPPTKVLRARLEEGRRQSEGTATLLEETTRQANVPQIIATSTSLDTVPAPLPGTLSKDSNATAGPANTFAKSAANLRPSTGESASAGRPSLNMAAQPVKVAVTDGDTSTDTAAVASVRPPSTSSLQGTMGVWTPTLDTPALNGGYENPNEPVYNRTGTSEQRPFSVRQSRRDLSGDDAQSASVSPIDRIKRTEGRSAGAFGEVALAFKQLQAEKRTLEKLIRATTPLDGLGANGETLAEYLTTMGSKLDASALEIRKLLDLLDQQRSVMDYMIDTHRLESAALTDELEDLRDDFDAVCEEADTHRDNAIRLTDELDSAQRDAVVARAEAMRAKAAGQEEESRKESNVRLLRQARNDLAKLEKERDAAQAELRAAGRSTDPTAVADGEAVARQDSDKSSVAPTGDSPDKSVRSLSDEDSTHSVVTAARTNALEKELAEAKAMNAELQRHLQEHQRAAALTALSGAPADSPAGRSMTESVPLSDGDDMERERDALRDKLFQQEKDVAELRAQIALGGSAAINEASTPVPGSTGGLPAAREDQVRLLMAQMSEQRSREAQIRKAYRQLRDDLRKMQSAQQNDRRRSQATYSLLVGGPQQTLMGGGSGSPTTPISAAGSSSHAPPSSAHQAVELAAASEGPTPRHLKRLSLPLVNRAASLLHGAGGNAAAHVPTNGHAAATPASTSLDEAGSESHARPTSSLTVSSTGGGTTPIFSSSRRISRNFTLERGLGPGGKRVGPPSMSGSDSGAEMSPRTPQLALQGEDDDTATAAAEQDVDDVDQHDAGVERDEERMEHLRTPRQSMVRDLSS